MFFPSVIAVKLLCADLLAAYSLEPSSNEVHWRAGSLNILPLSKNDHRRATRALPNLAQVFREWRRSLPPETERFLSCCLRKFYCERPYEDQEAYPENWFDGEYYYSPKTRRKLWREQKERFIEEVILMKDYLDLCLCVSAANEVALSLGHRGGVRISFAGYYPLTELPGHYGKVWQESKATKICRRWGREEDSVPETLFAFAKIVVVMD